MNTLRDSFALHLAASRSDTTTVIDLAALGRLIALLEASGTPTTARAVRRVHVESCIARRRHTVKPTTLSIKYRALQQFWKWAVDENEIDRSPMENMKAPRVPDAPMPVVSEGDFRKLLSPAEGRDLVACRDTAILLTLHETGIRRGDLAGLKVADVDRRTAAPTSRARAATSGP